MILPPFGSFFGNRNEEQHPAQSVDSVASIRAVLKRNMLGSTEAKTRFGILCKDSCYEYRFHNKDGGVCVLAVICSHTPSLPSVDQPQVPKRLDWYGQVTSAIFLCFPLCCQLSVSDPFTTYLGRSKQCGEALQLLCSPNLRSGATQQHELTQKSLVKPASLCIAALSTNVLNFLHALFPLPKAPPSKSMTSILSLGQRLWRPAHHVRASLHFSFLVAYAFK